MRTTPLWQTLYIQAPLSYLANPTNYYHIITTYPGVIQAVIRDGGKLEQPVMGVKGDQMRLVGRIRSGVMDMSGSELCSDQTCPPDAAVGRPGQLVRRSSEHARVV
jgi:hypothetical protein